MQISRIIFSKKNRFLFFSKLIFCDIFSAVIFTFINLNVYSVFSKVDTLEGKHSNELETFKNNIFANVNRNIKSYDICDGIYNLIDKLDLGFAIGLPYECLEILTKETGGQYLGSITLVGGLSNIGKSTFARNAVIPCVINKKERIVVMINEDNLDKWQRELLVFVANNILRENLQKYIVRDGHYTKEIKTILIKAADWIKEQTKNNLITIIPFKQYKTKNPIKIIKKYASMGFKYSYKRYKF